MVTGKGHQRLKNSMIYKTKCSYLATNNVFADQFFKAIVTINAIYEVGNLGIFFVDHLEGGAKISRFC